MRILKIIKNLFYKYQVRKMMARRRMIEQLEIKRYIKKGIIEK